jgi:type I restriction enzyme S subunit
MWPRIHLRDLVEHRLGKMLDKAKNTGVPRPYLRNPNVQWFDVDLSNLREILVEEKDVHKYELQVGDVLICEGGEAGRAALWKGEAKGIIFQKACHRVRVGPKLDARFLIHRLMYDYFTGGLNDYYTGTTIKHFTGQDLARYEIPLPPLDEQRRIAMIWTRRMRCAASANAPSTYSTASGNRSFSKCLEIQSRTQVGCRRRH